MLPSSDRIERQHESNARARPIDRDARASAVQCLGDRMKVVTLQQTEETIEAGSDPRVAVALERAPLPRQGDARHGASREADRTDRGESSEPPQEGRNREPGRFRDHVGVGRRPSSQRDEDRPLNRILPRDQEPFVHPSIHPGREEGGAPAVSAAFEESLVHEPLHVVPERWERLKKEPRRGPQVQARIRGGGEQDLEPAGMQEPAATAAAGGRSHRDVLHVEDRPDLAGDAPWSGHETRMQRIPQEVSPLS